MNIFILLSRNIFETSQDPDENPDMHMDFILLSKEKNLPKPNVYCPAFVNSKRKSRIMEKKRPQASHTV
jgi:hypothetical protein